MCSLQRVSTPSGSPPSAAPCRGPRAALESAWRTGGTRRAASVHRWRKPHRSVESVHATDPRRRALAGASSRFEGRAASRQPSTSHLSRFLAISLAFRNQLPRLYLCRLSVVKQVSVWTKANTCSLALPRPYVHQVTAPCRCPWGMGRYPPNGRKPPPVGAVALCCVGEWGGGARRRASPRPCRARFPRESEAPGRGPRSPTRPGRRG